MGTRPLTPDEAALWARVMAGVRPLRVVAKVAMPPASPTEGQRRAASPKWAPKMAAPEPSSMRAQPQPVSARSRRKESTNTLDGTWDRQLAKGLVSPDRSIDLHGHTLHSAHSLLDAALDQSIRAGDRVILLVTGKPPRPTSERPHQRGVIRAAVGDWLVGSRHAGSIAAVRAAHPRHGGAGALYIVLRRPRVHPVDHRKS